MIDELGKPPEKERIYHHPQWIRMPDEDTCPHFGLSKQFYYKLIKAGKIRSVMLKTKRGNMRGVRLVNYDSVCEYLASCQSNYAVQHENESYIEQ